MATEHRSKEYIVILFVVGALALNYPLLYIFSVSTLVLGIPLLYLYLFLIWLAIIVLIAVITEKCDGPAEH